MGTVAWMEDPSTTEIEAPDAPLVGVGPARVRIESLDVARGVALLGIFLVNVEYMSRPFGAAMGHAAPHGGGIDLALWWVVDALCEGKFYPLFSLLFGMGLALQRSNVVATGAAFGPLAIRRLGFLATLGLLHGLFLWYGDILFLYAVLGLLVGLVLRASARFLLVGATIALALAVMVGTFVGALQGAAEVAEAAEEHAHEMPLPEIDGPPLEVVWQQLRSTHPPGPEEPLWQAAETKAYSGGPWSQAEGFRAITFLLVLSSMAAGGALPILAMFLYGAALVKLDLLGRRRAWLWRVGVAGFAPGLPLAIMATWVSGFWGGPGALAVGAAFQTIAGALLAVGYLGASDLLVLAGSRFAPARRITGWLAAAGRMALTNYLLQTVIATGITYHWGFGRFGSLDRGERVALVLVVFGAQLLISRLWLARFRFGPLEWAWRSFTYRGWQPMRSAAAPPTPR